MRPRSIPRNYTVCRSSVSTPSRGSTSRTALWCASTTSRSWNRPPAMTTSQLPCPSCGSEVSRFDHYCGICGAVLAQLSWRTPGEERWHDKNGYLAVREGTSCARLLLRNHGVATAALVLRAEDIAELPDWIDRAELAEQLYIIQPGEAAETPIEIPLHTEALNRL